jgi:hypothetical protein
MPDVRQLEAYEIIESGVTTDADAEFLIPLRKIGF